MDGSSTWSLPLACETWIEVLAPGEPGVAMTILSFFCNELANENSLHVCICLSNNSNWTCHVLFPIVATTNHNWGILSNRFPQSTSWKSNINIDSESIPSEGCEDSVPCLSYCFNYHLPLFTYTKHHFSFFFLSQVVLFLSSQNKRMDQFIIFK